MTRMKVKVVAGLQCPKCGASELHPKDGTLLIRGLKVYDKGHLWSQCLVCAGFINEFDSELKFNNKAGDDNKGWF